MKRMDRHQQLIEGGKKYAQRHQLPGFIIIGAQKGGTTAFYRCLLRHPDDGRAARKEIHFFDRSFDQGMDWYLAHFPKKGKPAIVGEASPHYIFNESVPGRIFQSIPDVKLIALLRYPVDRAYSHYQMNMRKGIEPLSFEDAISQEPVRLRENIGSSETEWRNSTFVSYLTRGQYASQLRRWLDSFSPQQVFVHTSETFSAQPDQVLRRVFEFVGLPPWRPPVFETHNAGAYDAMRPETRARLAAHFAPYNQELYQLLGRDLGWEAASNG